MRPRVENMIDDEIDRQVLWHEQVMTKVLRETGCILTHQALVIVIQEFGELVKQIKVEK